MSTRLVAAVGRDKPFLHIDTPANLIRHRDWQGQDLDFFDSAGAPLRLAGSRFHKTGAEDRVVARSRIWEAADDARRIIGADPVLAAEFDRPWPAADLGLGALMRRFHVEPAPAQVAVAALAATPAGGAEAAAGPSVVPVHTRGYWHNLWHKAWD